MRYRLNQINYIIIFHLQLFNWAIFFILKKTKNKKNKKKQKLKKRR